MKYVYVHYLYVGGIESYSNISFDCERELPISKQSSYFIKLHFRKTAFKILFHNPLILGFSVKTQQGA